MKYHNIAPSIHVHIYANIIFSPKKINHRLMINFRNWKSKGFYDIKKESGEFTRTHNWLILFLLGVRLEILSPFIGTIYEMGELIQELLIYGGAVEKLSKIFSIFDGEVLQRDLTLFDVDDESPYFFFYEFAEASVFFKQSFQFYNFFLGNVPSRPLGEFTPKLDFIFKFAHNF